MKALLITIIVAVFSIAGCKSEAQETMDEAMPVCSGETIQNLEIFDIWQEMTSHANALESPSDKLKIIEEGQIAWWSEVSDKVVHCNYAFMQYALIGKSLNEWVITMLASGLDAKFTSDHLDFADNYDTLATQYHELRNQDQFTDQTLPPCDVETTLSTISVSGRTVRELDSIDSALPANERVAKIEELALSWWSNSQELPECHFALIMLFKVGNLLDEELIIALYPFEANVPRQGFLDKHQERAARLREEISQPISN